MNDEDLEYCYEVKKILFNDTRLQARWFVFSLEIYNRFSNQI